MMRETFNQPKKCIDYFTMTIKIATLILFIYIPTMLCGKDLSWRYKYLSLGPKHSGICFGTPKTYNGIRLNLWDRMDAQINGLSISGFSGNKKTNGVTLGIVSTKDKVLNGIELGALVAKSSNSNGIKIGGIIADGKKQNGLVLSCMYIAGKKINGIGTAGLQISAENLNGIFIGFAGICSMTKQPIKVINGIAIGGYGVSSTIINGFSFSMNNLSSYQAGVSIGLLNFSDELHGFQFGLINYAGNNRRLFRVTPILNFHLKKKNKR